MNEGPAGLLRQTRRRIRDIAQIYSTFSWPDATRTIIGRTCTLVARKPSITPGPLAFWLQLIGSTALSKTAPEEWNIRPYIVRKTGCFIDVGGSVGLHTKYVCDMGIEVFAFEPDPRSFKILQRIVPKAHLYPFAVGNEDSDKAAFALYRDQSHGRLAEASTGPNDKSHSPVRVVRLDSLKLPRVAVIKIDTEGSELPVLEGATQLIKRDMPRAIIEIHRPFEKQKELVVRFMREKGYSRIRQVWKPFRNQYHLVFFEPEKNGPLPNPPQS